MAEASPWIAIVDDDPSVLKALSPAAAHPRIRTQGPTESADEFLVALPNGPPECLIVDLQMPQMSGLELLHQHLRSRGYPNSDHRHHRARRYRNTRERCESAGAVAFLLKPLQDTALFAAIDLARKAASSRVLLGLNGAISPEIGVIPPAIGHAPWVTPEIGWVTLREQCHIRNFEPFFILLRPLAHSQRLPCPRPPAG